MKHLLAILVLFAPLSGWAQPSAPAVQGLTVEQDLGPLTLALFRWTDPNPAPSPVDRFYLFLGEDPRPSDSCRPDESCDIYTTMVDAEMPEPDASGVYAFSWEIDAVYPTYAALTAYDDDASMESAFSNEVVRDPCEGSPDFDGDGFCDWVDNCIEIANELQCDGDGDGYGNACDADFDQNGVAGVADFNIMAGVWATGDPIADLNCDGVVGGEDFSEFCRMFGQAPGPSAWRP